MAHGRMMMRCVFLACLVAASVSSTASAFVFKAGGTGEWRVPAAAAASDNGNGNVSAYNAWAQRNRFRVGDAIAFTYQPANDSVLLVDKRSYDACDTSAPIDTFADGSTVYNFTRSGPFYFVSGNKFNCNRGEKLIVVVMAERAAIGNGTEPGAGLAPSPNGPFSSFSPPPPFGIDISPTPAYPPPSAAAPKMVGVAGTAAFAIGALFYALV
ncbi:early nodulin-like protein 9 [Miscanthus floridulus]|uniref:early nodulin-like protein 9 n=1 Tax=Miscanthus floridulus TaxID=154761 RepID=UPI00345A03DE